MQDKQSTSVYKKPDSVELRSEQDLERDPHRSSLSPYSVSSRSYLAKLSNMKTDHYDGSNRVPAPPVDPRLRKKLRKTFQDSKING